MQFEKMLKIIETHTAGSPTRHIVGGAPQIEGNTMAEKMQYLHDHHDWIRKTVMQEPRGHSSMSGALYVPPCNPQADMGIIYFDSCDYMTMCGHSTIAVSTVLVETGMVEKKEPVTVVKLDTPAGLVTAEVQVKDGNVKEVTFSNVPSFLYASEDVEVEGYGTVHCDVAFGGMAYAIVSAGQFGVTVDPSNVHKLMELAHRVFDAVQPRIGFVHPQQPFMDRIHSVMFTQPGTDGADSKEVVILIPAEEGNSTAVDRSPCGTGTSARVAAELAHGTIAPGQSFVQESIVGTRFTGRIDERQDTCGYVGGIPKITGSAYITALSDFVISAEDPLKDGFILV